MAKVNFTDCTGVLHVIEVENGWSLMEAAIDNDVFGITADCGGACSCATCHAYIDESWLEKLPEVGCENYYGFGEKGGPLDKKGETISFWNTDSFSYNTDDSKYQQKNKSSGDKLKLENWMTPTDGL